MEIYDFANLFESFSFKVFASMIKNDERIKAVNAK
jgi:hypothetical protein